MKLSQPPRWPLYCKLRKAIARELAAERQRLGLAEAVDASDVDGFLLENWESVVKDLEHLFVHDINANMVFIRPGAGVH